MSLYSFLSALAFLFYIEMGIFILIKNHKNKKNILLFIGNLCMALSSLFQALIYSASSNKDCLFFYHFYSPLLIITICIFFNFSLILTDNKFFTKKIIIITLYLPAIIYGINGIFNYNMIKDYVLIGNTWFEIMQPINLWVLSYIIIYQLYFLISVILIVRWGKKSNLLKEKMQARTIFTGFLISFFMTNLINFVQPLIFKPPIVPRISSVTYLFLLASIWYAMIKYEFLGKTPSSMEKNYLWKHLTKSEKIIVSMIYEGLTNKEIAYKLCRSEGTIRKHIENIFKKTKISNRTELISKIYFSNYN